MQMDGKRVYRDLGKPSGESWLILSLRLHTALN